MIDNKLVAYQRIVYISEKDMFQRVIVVDKPIILPDILTFGLYTSLIFLKPKTAGF